MLGVNQLDFLNYTTAFKGNYRKGPHKLRAILSTPTQAKEFCTNLGGVSVIFGVPLDRPDKNSEELLEILQGSPYNDMAVETWLHGFYDFDSLDTLLYDAAMCQALANDAAIFRAVGTSEVAVGKLLCGLAGLDPANYENIDAVAASDIAMVKVAASKSAMAAAVRSPIATTTLVGSKIAMTALVASSVAMDTIAGSQAYMTVLAGNSAAMTIVAGSETAMASVAKSKTAMTAVAASQTAMAAVAASQTAMTAIGKSATARSAVAASTTAMNAICASSMATAKYATGAAGLDPSGYADMTAVAASSTAMAAIIANASALNAVVSSQTAMAAVAASQTAMAAVAGNTNAMKAVASSAVALNAICKNATARAAFIGSAYRDTYYSQILSSLGNTTYFTAKTTSLNSGEVKAWDTDYYINGSSFAVNTTTAKTADSSFCYIETAYAESSSHNAKITTLQGSVSLLSTTSTSKTARHWCIPGGFKYNNANFTGCRVYLAK